MDRTIVSHIEAEYGRYKGLAERAFEQLDPADLAYGDNAAMSVATIIWHIAGNLESRFTDFLTSDGEKPWRDRESEFATRHDALPALREKWERGWGALLGTLRDLSDADLSRTITIREVPLRVDEALFRSLAHTCYHVGQIVYVAKSRRGEDWEYLSIPPGGSAAYNSNPTAEKASQHARRLEGGASDGANAP